MLELVLLDGTGRRFAIPEGGELKVGVGVDCAVRLSADDVSRAHAVVADRGGTAVVLDLGSKNGTFLNGRRIREAEVTAGDLVRFSSVPGQIVRAGELSAEEAPSVAPSSPSDGEPTATGEWIDADLPSALNRLLACWRDAERPPVVSLVQWLVESRGMQGAAVLEPVTLEITVVAAHGELGSILEDPRCLALVRERRVMGSAVESVQLGGGGQRILGISAGSLPWLLLIPRSSMPDNTEVEMWVHLLGLACRLDHCVTGGQENVGKRSRG